MLRIARAAAMMPRAAVARRCGSAVISQPPRCSSTAQRCTPTLAAHTVRFISCARATPTRAPQPAAAAAAVIPPSASSSTPPLPPPPSCPPPPPPASSRSWLRVALWSLVGLVGASSVALVLINQKLEPADRMRQSAGSVSTFANALVRFWRDMYCAARIVADYELSLRGLSGAELEQRRNEVHLRSALRLRDLMYVNGGVYIKFGQHIAQLQFLLPDEYVLTMQPMLNQAPTSSLEDVRRVFREEFGAQPEDMFESFDPVPVASASLAQVHFGTLKRKDPSSEPERVAVKIQHAALQHNCDSDIATVRFIIELIHRVDSRFDYTWLADEMAQSLPLECNFINEAQNSERARRNLRCDERSDVNVPRIHWNQTSKRVLTMERMDGCIVTDTKRLAEMGIEPKAVSTLLSEVFSEMIFMHGFVHCDPHAGNVFVQRRSASDARPRLILLDHGLYKSLDDSFRLSYAHLWNALIKGDKAGIKRYAQEMNAGELYPLFASMLTRKPYEEITARAGDLESLRLRNDESEREALQAWAVEYAQEVQTILARIPRPLLLLLKTNDCLRAVDTQLGTPINSFLIMARFCNRAITDDRVRHSPSMVVKLGAIVERMQMDLRLRSYSFMIWIGQWLAWIKQKMMGPMPVRADCKNAIALRQQIQHPTIALTH